MNCPINGAILSKNLDSAVQKNEQVKNIEKENIRGFVNFDKARCGLIFAIMHRMERTGRTYRHGSVVTIPSLLESWMGDVCPVGGPGGGGGGGPDGINYIYDVYIYIIDILLPQDSHSAQNWRSKNTITI